MDEELLMSLPLKFVNNTIEDYAMQVTFDPREGTGKVVYNISLVKNEDLETSISIFKDAYKSGICVSGLVRFVEGGKKIGDLVIPHGETAIITMCSSTLDGILLKRGYRSIQSGGELSRSSGGSPEGSPILSSMNTPRSTRSRSSYLRRSPPSPRS